MDVLERGADGTAAAFSWCRHLGLPALALSTAADPSGIVNLTFHSPVEPAPRLKRLNIDKVAHRPVDSMRNFFAAITIRNHVGHLPPGPNPNPFDKLKVMFRALGTADAVEIAETAA